MKNKLRALSTALLFATSIAAVPTPMVAGTRGAVLLLVLEVKDRREVARESCGTDGQGIRQSFDCPPPVAVLPRLPFHVPLPPPPTCRQILTYHMV